MKWNRTASDNIVTGCEVKAHHAGYCWRRVDLASRRRRRCYHIGKRRQSTNTNNDQSRWHRQRNQALLGAHHLTQMVENLECTRCQCANLLMTSQWTTTRRARNRRTSRRSRSNKKALRNRYSVSSLIPRRWLPVGARSAMRNSESWRWTAS